MRTIFKQLNVIALLVMVFSILIISCDREDQVSLNEGSNQKKAIPLNPGDMAMYATDWTAGDIVSVNFAPYAAAGQPARLNPSNALGEFDAAPGIIGVNEYFYGLAAREWTNYTFDEVFCNVDVIPDIEFAEVTWGPDGGWHAEAAKVYLTDAFIVVNGDIVPYGTQDDDIGYYAGIVWNKIGINSITPERQLEITESYFSGTRNFSNNTFEVEGNYGKSLFYLPNEVVCASGITLVDITKDIYGEAFPVSYTNPTGYKVTVNDPAPDDMITSADVTSEYGYPGNTDGFDLDAIRVYRCSPKIGDDTATGSGDRIRKKGTWFMYNVYTGPGESTYDIQAGNPAGGERIIGTYKIVKNVDGTFTATYDIDETIKIGDWEYKIVVKDEHLAISDKMNFTAAPGKDDNADWGVAFEASAPFFIFAHFAVTYE